MSAGRPLSRYPVESAYRLDLATLKAKGWLVPGSVTTGRYWWAYPWGDRDEATVTADLTSSPSITVQLDGEELQRINLTSTLQRFGGVRWWMLCPYSARRCRTLYLPNGGRLFASRQSYRLVYRTQQMSPDDRAWHRVNKLLARLGSEYSDDEVRRPKGMWGRTFAKRMAQLNEADKAVDDTFLGYIARNPELLAMIEGENGGV